MRGRLERAFQFHGFLLEGLSLHQQPLVFLDEEIELLLLELNPFLDLLQLTRRVVVLEMNRLLLDRVDGLVDKFPQWLALLWPISCRTLTLALSMSPGASFSETGARRGIHFGLTVLTRLGTSIGCLAFLLFLLRLSLQQSFILLRELVDTEPHLGGPFLVLFSQLRQVILMFQRERLLLRL